MHVNLVKRRLRPERSQTVEKATANREESTCHNFASSGVMYTVSTSSESVADSSTNETHLDIETLFRVHYGRVARIIARAVRDHARSEELAEAHK